MSQFYLRNEFKATDRTLFTPGPLTTSRTVKQAMLRDMGSRDIEFFTLTNRIRQKLLAIAEVSSSEYTTVLMQGSGTFSVESVITSATPKNGKILIIANGAYGSRMIQIAKVASVSCVTLEYAEDQKPDLAAIEKLLASDSAITNIAMVHCETTSGILNPIAEVGALAQKYQKTYFVDAMSSFGAAEIALKKWNIDYLVSSANKCLEGVPGLGFIIARKEKLQGCQNQARSLSLDLYSQWKDLEEKSEFRYTPPIQVLLALDQAIVELEAEGGVAARTQRYRENHSALIQGMRALGFKEYLPEKDQGYIITSFHYLTHPKFSYTELYERLLQHDVIIYSGKVTNAQCFRIGNIGRIFKADINRLLLAMSETLKAMGVNA